MRAASQMRAFARAAATKKHIIAGERMPVLTMSSIYGQALIFLAMLWPSFSDPTRERILCIGACFHTILYFLSLYSWPRGQCVRFT